MCQALGRALRTQWETKLTGSTSHGTYCLVKKINSK